MSETPEQSPEGLRHEYTEVNENFRHYSALRFAILTVYFAVVAGLASVAFGVTKPDPSMVGDLAKAGGLVVTVAFFMLEIILERYLTHYGDVARQIEKSLGYSQFSTKPKSRILKTRHATWGIYVVLLLFWAYTVFFA